MKYEEAWATQYWCRVLSRLKNKKKFKMAKDMNQSTDFVSVI